MLKQKIFCLGDHPSKTSDQTLTFWTRTPPLSDIVRLEDTPSPHSRTSGPYREKRCVNARKHNILGDPDDHERGWGLWSPKRKIFAQNFQRLDVLFRGRPPVRGRPLLFDPPIVPDVFDGWPLVLFYFVQIKTVNVK